MVKKKVILLIPYPAQGHITPMLKLSSILSDLGFRPVLITPEFIHRRINNLRDDLLCLSIPDGLDIGVAPPDFFSIQRAMEENMPASLEELVRKMIGDDEENVVCLVADLLASWAFDVARRCGVEVAGFWPAMHATYRVIDAIPEFIRNGIISNDGCPNDPNVTICNDPTLIANDLPWLIGSPTARIARFKFWTRTLERSKALRFILMNTFPGEVIQRSNVINVDETFPQVLGVGPLIMQDATIKKRSLWEEDRGCLDWLDERAVGSVIYVSFGSWVSPIGDLKIKGLALALEALGMPFIWVLGDAWRGGLPDGYVERATATHGMIVSWAPQLEVLRHPAVGCYLTHCGWNSTLEAIQCKKPMLCCPIAGDQFVNCAYIVDTWKNGAKLEGFGVEEVEKGVRKVVEDKQMIQRIEKANDKFYGGEGRSKAMQNLLSFIQDFGK